MTSPFDHKVDHEIGDPLREALTMGNEAAFVRRVNASAETLFGALPQGQGSQLIKSHLLI